MTDEVIITCRPYEYPNDDAYIYSTWTKYAWYSPKSPISLPKGEWMKEKCQEIKDLLQNGIVRIACIKECPSVIMGYAVFRDGELKWMCIKKQYRNQGIERMLMKK